MIQLNPISKYMATHNYEYNNRCVLFAFGFPCDNENGTNHDYDNDDNNDNDYQ